MVMIFFCFLEFGGYICFNGPKRLFHNAKRHIKPGFIFFIQNIISFSFFSHCDIIFMIIKGVFLISTICPGLSIYLGFFFKNLHMRTTLHKK